MFRSSITAHPVVEFRTFTSEVIGVALKVENHGVVGGQATDEGKEGTWEDLTNSACVIPMHILMLLCQRMAFNLTNQVQSVVSVTKAVARGDLTKYEDCRIRREG